ncbi:MAG: hypothetical protein QXH00_11160 [Candidatus Jordarchaeales archaeon]
MPKAGERGWLTVKLTPELQKKFDEYILAVANKIGRVPYAVKSKITIMALEEWFRRHGDDLDLFT